MYLAFIPARSLQLVTRRGDFSYGVYLYGYPVQQMLLRTWANKIPFPLIIGLSCAGALFLAVLSWHLVEKPFLKLKKRSSRAAAPVPNDVSLRPAVLERKRPLVDVH
jgi:peptidoglycan/LPS O-acetylase OafA/YrhL